MSLAPRSRVSAADKAGGGWSSDSFISDPAHHQYKLNDPHITGSSIERRGAAAAAAAATAASATSSNRIAQAETSRRYGRSVYSAHPDIGDFEKLGMHSGEG